MQVATFNATTGWAGRQILWQDERLVLDGYGVITAADVMEYDRQGQLDWPSTEMRSWAAARLSWEQAVAVPASAQTAAAVPAASEPAQAEPAIVAGPAATTVESRPPEELRDVLAPAGDIVEVVGTMPYQEALASIAGEPPETVHEVEKWAHLIPEPDNPWDRNAVAVYIGSRKVGYLPRRDTAAYASLLGQLWVNLHARAVCRAVVSGGWQRLENQVGETASVDEGRLGVRLALAAPQYLDVTQSLTTLTSEELEAGPPPV
jgi:hypothetical protein